ncbi:MAG: NAD-dependent epimerase/dehydratase family protein [Planctomycetota bacterium]
MPENSQIPGGGARRVLVSGGAGFIGSHLCELLCARGDSVTVVDDLSTGRRGNAGLYGHARFIESRLSDALSGPLADEAPFDEVYHLAAAVGVKLVMEHPAESIENNVGETAALLRYCEDHGRPRTLIASSSEVYGKPGTAVFSEEDDTVYGPTTATRWSYACSKAIDEYLALACSREGRVPCTIVRFFNTVGPRQVGDYGMVLPTFVRASLAGEPIRVHGTGKQSRCFADVRDVVTALPRLLAETSSSGRVFNLGSDTPITILELARLVIEQTNSSSSIETVPYERVYGPGFEDLLQRRPDLSRLRDVIAYEPRHALADTVRDVAAWLSEEEHGAPGEAGGDDRAVSA